MVRRVFVTLQVASLEKVGVGVGVGFGVGVGVSPFCG